MNTLRNKKIKEIIEPRKWVDKCMYCDEIKDVSSCGCCGRILCNNCMNEHLQH